jgi:tRNA threonylcarbamoyladenosine biosynthesis protein TsaB
LEAADIYILNIDTSQKVCSAALFKNDILLAATNLYNEKSASGLLTPIIEQLLINCNLKQVHLNAVAVASGPGSYTGLRIAVSTAKGICLAIDKPLIATNTLLGMANSITQYYPNNYLFCPMLDARRQEVFCAVFDSELNIVENTNAKIIDEDSFAELLEEKTVVFFGDGAAKCKSVFGKNKNAIFLDFQYPIASNLGQLAFQKYQNNQFENLVTFEPYYLKDFIGTVKS